MPLIVNLHLPKMEKKILLCIQIMNSYLINNNIFLVRLRLVKLLLSYFNNVSLDCLQRMELAWGGINGIFSLEFHRIYTAWRQNNINIVRMRLYSHGARQSGRVIKICPQDGLTLIENDYMQAPVCPDAHCIATT